MYCTCSRDYFSLSLGSERQKRQAQIAAAIASFERFPGDTGSSEVQIAVMSEKILALTTHLQIHKKDVHCKRGLMAQVTKRKNLLTYLKKNIAFWRLNHPIGL